MAKKSSAKHEHSLYGWHAFTSGVFIVLILLITFFFQDRVLALSFFDFLLITLATFRLTHLFVYDTVMDFARDYFLRHPKGLHRSMAELTHCPWCTGTWMALFVVFIYFLTPLSRFFIIVVAIAGVATCIEMVLRYLKRN